MGFDLGDEAIADQSGSFKNWEFFELYLEFGLVATLFGLGSLAILHWGVRYRVTRVRSFLATSVLMNEWWFSTFALPLEILVWVAYLFVPVAGLFGWGLAAAITLDPSIVGVTVILLSVALASGVYGFGLWRANAWRLTYPSGIACAVCLTMFMAFQLGVITATEPFSYIGFSAVFLSVNVVPMIVILYLNMAGTYVRFEKFVTDAIGGSPSEYSDAGRGKTPCFGCCGPALSRNHVRSLGLYAVAQGTLCAYALLVFKYIDDDTVKYVGFANWGALFVCDVILYMYYMGGFFDSSLSASLFFIAVRAIMIIFGAKYWFIAHSVVFVLVALFLGLSWVKDHYPARRTAGAAIVAHESLAKTVLESLPTPGYLNLRLADDVVVASSEFSSSELEATVTAATDGGTSSAYDVSSVASSDDDDATDDEYGDEYSEEQESASEYDDESAYTYGTDEGDVAETEYSSEYTTIGSCCRVPRLSSIFLTRPFMMLVMSAAFVAEVLVVETKEEATQDMKLLSKTRRQYLFGIGAIVMSLVLPLVFFTYRLYQRAKFRFTGAVLASAFVTEVVIVGNGVFFYFAADSIVVLGFHIFFPIIAFCALATMIQWIRNDYFFFSSAADRADGETVCGLLPRDWGMVGGTAATLLNIFGLSLTVALGLDAQITGWTIGTVIFVPLCTFVSIKEWFNTFTFSWTNGVSVVAQIAVLLGYAVGVFVSTLESKVDERSLALLFLILVYPTLVLLVVGVWKWADDKWAFKYNSPAGRFITFSLVASFLLMAGFGVVVMLVYKPFWAGLGVLVVVGIFYSLVWVSISFVRNGFYLTKPYRVAIGVVLCGAIAMGLGVGLTESGFLGFCISWGSLFVMLTLVAVQDWFNARNQPRQFGKFIFPVYKLEVANDRLASANVGLYCAYGALIVGALWGVAAALFFPPPWVGLLVTAGAVTLFVLLTVHLLWDPPATFGAQLRYIDAEVLDKARAQAKGHELTVAVARADVVRKGGSDDSEYGYYYSGSGEDEGEYSEEQEEAKSSSSAAYGSESVSSNGRGRFLRENGEVATSGEVLAERAEFEANELGDRESYLELLRYDRGVNAAYKAEQRFVAHMQRLALSLAQFKRVKEEAIVSAMLKDTPEYNDDEFPLTPGQIEQWGKKEWRAFQNKMTRYLRKQRLLTQRNESRRNEDAKAQAKRNAARLKLQRELEQKRRKKKGKKEESGSESGGQVTAAGLSFNPRTAPVVGPDPAKLIAKMEKRGEMWSDDEFVADDSALYLGKAAVSGRVAGWARPEEVYENKHGHAPGAGDIAVFDESIRPGDIRQGALGDCWLLSAFAIVAQHPERVREIFEVDEVNDAGVYAVKLWAGGKWMRVVIDSKLPVDDRGRLAYGKTGSGDGAELWTSLLEKAFGKMYGSYGALNGGLVHMGLVDLTGGQAETVAFHDEAAEADIQSGRLWKKILGYHKAGYLMGCGSNAGKDTAKSKAGIVQGHAYAILDAQEVSSSVRLLKIMNPWGSGEWTGDWSDQSDKWTRRLKAKLGWSEEDDGIFFMEFADFVREFRNLYVCRIFPDSWHAVGVPSAWTAASAGGCANFDTCKNNPQFLLSVSVPTTAFITVAKDMLNAEEVEHLAFTVFAAKGAAKIDPQYVRSGDRVATSGKYSSLREVSVEVTLKPGKYVIVPTTFKPGQKGAFVVTANTDKKVSLVEIGADAAGPSAAAAATSDAYTYDDAGDDSDYDSDDAEYEYES